IIWAGTWGGGLARFQQGKWTNYGKTSGLLDDRIMCLMETKSPQGKSTLWLGTYAAGLASIDLDDLPNAKWKTVKEIDGKPVGGVYSLLETKSANGESIIWVGSAGAGLMKLQK